MVLLTTDTDGRWHPGIGDPDATGWITVAAYTAAMILFVLCARRETLDERRRKVWIFLALVMAMFGINKQLDLQSWFTEIGRDMALAQGWYVHRNQVQVAFIAALAVSGVLVSIVLWRVYRDLGAEVRRALLGLVLLTVFVVVRATSFHHVDRLLGMELGAKVRLNAVLELGSIAIMASAAWARLRRGSAALGRPGVSIG